MPGANVGTWSNLCLLRHLQSVIDLDTQIPNSALQLRMAEQQLHCSQVLRSAIDQRCFGSTKRMGTVERGVETDCGYPVFTMRAYCLVDRWAER